MYRYFSRCKENSDLLPSEQDHPNLHQAIDAIKDTPKLSPEKAAQLLLRFDPHGRVQLCSTLANLDLAEEKEPSGGRNKFTRRGDNIYAFSKTLGKKNKWKHSSILAEGAVHASGEVVIANRKIVKIDNFGGHHRSSPESILLTLYTLEKAHPDALSELKEINIYQLIPGFKLNMGSAQSMWGLYGPANICIDPLSIKELRKLLDKKKYREPLLEEGNSKLKCELKEKIVSILQHHFGFFTSDSYADVETFVKVLVPSPSFGL